MIAELGKPKTLDTLIVDDVLYPLTYRDGSLGYMRDEDNFIPVDEKSLKPAAQRRGNAPTWTLRPVGTKRVRLPKTQPKNNEKKFSVNMNFEHEVFPIKVVKAVDARLAQSKAIRWLAATRRLPFAKVFDYFNRHPQSIKVTSL
jgi:hypothetical protein